MKILVYDDSPDYGGHQIMACLGIEALTSDPSIEVVCMFNPANRKLRERLKDHTILQFTRNFQSLEVDKVLCIQGDVRQSFKGIDAAMQADIECISYIAIPHRMAHMGAKLGALRDIGHRRLFNKPDRYITISESMKKLLIERGARKPISVVPNGIQTPPATPQNRSDIQTIGLLGRIEFNQKQQDFMVRTFLNHPKVFEDCRLLIAGNGPDENKLKAMIAGNENIVMIPWQENPESFYEQIDLLIIPSRYEGVLLVMLEALARSIPVIGSDRDGMKDLLPHTWTFETENADALIETFSHVRQTWQNEIDPLRQKVLSEHSLERFKVNFSKAVIGQ
ncbi:MAG: glycosyltransferase family 4 protein [Pontiella sp.]|nr:glycosyltransferase family 4 protein [Pontiella sp.]